MYFYSKDLMLEKEVVPSELIYTIDTTKYNSTYATGYAPFVTGNYSKLSGKTITIDWGDNSTSTITDGVISTTTNTHTYSSPGTYQIKITAEVFPQINFRLVFGWRYAIILTSVDSVLPYCIDTTGSAVTDFGNCFCKCSSLTTIPSRLFDNNTAVTSFYQCFQDCSSLTSIPTGLFDKCTAVTAFSSCFYTCSSLTSIPTDLFKYNTAVTAFGECFGGCTNLTSIPEGLFKYNTAATYFSYCFYNCPKLQLNANIFCNEATEMTTRFASVTPNFTQCFGISSFSGTQGTAPQLWNYTYSGTPTSTNCFTGHSATSLTNYSSIPTAWGGPA